MDWHDLLFMHWRVDPAHLRPFIPPSLEIETFDGSAWLGIVPFEMRGTRARLTPPIPGLSCFPELNVRTYVRPTSAEPVTRSGNAHGGGGDTGDTGGGVWFFSLDATSRAAVEAARLTFSLPYFRAAMRIGRGDPSWIEYEHRRTDSNERLMFGTAHPAQARFNARYRPIGPVTFAQPCTLESFLTDRYRLYSWSGDRGSHDPGRLYVGEIHHPPWPLQVAEAEIQTNTMAGFIGIDSLPGEPLLHFVRAVKVAAWRPRRVPPR